jgi:hypothetical protein
MKRLDNLNLELNTADYIERVYRAGIYYKQNRRRKWIEFPKILKRL